MHRVWQIGITDRICVGIGKNDKKNPVSEKLTGCLNKSHGAVQETYFS